MYTVAVVNAAFSTNSQLPADETDACLLTVKCPVSEKAFFTVMLFAHCNMLSTRLQQGVISQKLQHTSKNDKSYTLKLSA